MALPRVRVDVGADTAEAEAGLDRVEQGIRDVGGAATKAGSKLNRMTNAMGRGGNRRMGAFSMGVRNASYQIGDFAVQVGAGTAASVALGQQLPQLLGSFGLFGVVLSAVVAIAIPLSRALSGVKVEGEGLSVMLGSLQPAGLAVADAFKQVAAIGIEMATVVVNNLDRILIAAGVVAGFFAVKFVAAMVIAKVATFSLAGAWRLLDRTMRASVIVGLIVVTTELIRNFLRLKEVTGSWGAAFALVKDVALEVWDRIKIGMELLGVKFKRIVNGIQYVWTLAMGNLAVSWGKFIDALIAKTPAKIRDWMGLEGGNAQEAQEEMNKALDQLNMEDIGLGNREANLKDQLAAPLESVMKIRDLLASIKEDKIDLPSLLGAGEDEDENGKKKKSPWDLMIENMQRVHDAQQHLKNASASMWSAMSDFIQQFAGKSKAAAIAALAIQKGLAIGQIIVNTAAAQMRALAELGPIAGPPVAAAIGTYGKIQAALVAATGLMQAGAIMGGGGGGGAGGVPGAANNAGSIQAGEQSAPMQQKSLTLIGDRFNRQQAIEIAEFMNEGTDDGLVVRGRR